MLRKQILSPPSVASTGRSDEKDIAAVATVLITSEDPAHPVDYVFDHHRGPGGTRWMAATSGEQILILAFDSPQMIRQVTLEIEEPDVSRTQEVLLAVSRDGQRSYQGLIRQEYTFSPPHTTFEREVWRLDTDGVTHLRLAIKPDKGGRAPHRATVTSLALE